MLPASARTMSTVVVDPAQLSTGSLPPLAPGRVFKGRYRLGDPLGRGGMGTVYEVEHLTTGRRLAMKVLRAEVARRPEIVRRFLAEARTAAAVCHPAIVQIVDLDQEDDLHFIVMERLVGEELAARMRRLGPLPIPFVIHLGTALADGISAAHRHVPRVIHRDLKPENVFLARADDQSETIKILDFGIAKLIEPDELEPSLTLTGEVYGTPVYMSPEQLRSTRDVDERTDLYAIGVILYQALAGRLPFVASSFADLILQVNTQTPPPLAQLRPDVPAPLAQVVERAMARQRDDRPATAAELSAALTACLRAPAAAAQTVAAGGAPAPADLSPHIRIPQDPRKLARPAAGRWWVWMVAALAGLAIGLGLGLVTSGRVGWAPSPPGDRRGSAQVAELRMAHQRDGQVLLGGLLDPGDKGRPAEIEVRHHQRHGDQADGAAQAEHGPPGACRARADADHRHRQDRTAVERG
jgi:eukaryotic-like serine/threonine-protein kinase